MHNYDKIRDVFDAMLDMRRVSVKTETREFHGHIYEMGISPFREEPRARLVDAEGRVHYFYIDSAEVKCF